MTRLDEDFSSTNAHSVWTTGSSGSGTSRIAGANASLFIESGVQSGTRTWVETVQPFDTSTGVEQILDIRCAPVSNPINPGDMAFWGFHHEAFDRVFAVGFRVKWGPQGGTLEARVNNGQLTRSILLPAIDILAMHDYSVAVVDDRALFLVDGQEVWEWTGFEVPQGLLRVRLQKTSPGRNQVLEVESVRLSEVLGARTARTDQAPDLEGGSAAAGQGGSEPSAAPPATVSESSWGALKSAYR